MEGRKVKIYSARLYAPFRRALRACVGRAAAPTGGPRERETDELALYYGTWPGHEADYPVIHRLLREMGKEGRRRDGKNSGGAKKLS
jgi:hypothetical protein